MNRKPIGLSVPYRRKEPETTLAELEKAVKTLTDRVKKIETQLKEKSK